MATIKTQHLLFKVAHSYVNKRKTFSKEEIVKKINQIKYLSEQKKVPKLSLRKEIVHLENKLQSIFDLEKKIFEHEKRESSKVASLKKEIAKLKRLITTSSDQDLSHKVNKLSHVLGDVLAKKHSIEDIALSKHIVKEDNQLREKTYSDEIVLHTLEKKLQFLKEQFNLKKNTNPVIAKMLEEKISLVEKKLNEKLNKPNEIPVIKQKPKHVMIFESPKQKPVNINMQELEKELPLPPPPRMN